MPNISITYSAAGQADIDAGNDIELKSMSVSNDGSSWIDCTDCKWTGSLYEGTVTATFDDYEISYVQITYNSDEVLCSGSGTTIATLANGQSLAISFKPNDICTGLITNTSSGGGGGGGEIDPAVLNAKQDKELESSIIVNNFNTDLVEEALFALANYTNYTQVINSSNDIQYFNLSRLNNSVVVIDGVIATVDSTSRFDCTIKIPPSITMSGTYYGNLPADCDIIIVNGQLYAKLAVGALFCIRMCMNRLYDIEAIEDSATTEAPGEAIASLSTDAINLSAGGGGSRSPYDSISTDPINADT